MLPLLARAAAPGSVCFLASGDGRGGRLLLPVVSARRAPPGAAGARHRPRCARPLAAHPPKGLLRRQPLSSAAVAGAVGRGGGGRCGRVLTVGDGRGPGAGRGGDDGGGGREAAEEEDEGEQREISFACHARLPRPRPRFRRHPPLLLGPQDPAQPPGAEEGLPAARAQARDDERLQGLDGPDDERRVEPLARRRGRRGALCAFPPGVAGTVGGLPGAGPRAGVAVAVPSGQDPGDERGRARGEVARGRGGGSAARPPRPPPPAV